MIEKMLDKIDKQSITISQWVTAFIGIFFVRFFLETLSSPTRSGIIPSDAITVIHYALFWVVLVLSLIIVVGFFTKNYRATSKVALFALPAIWIAPIFDIIISKGNGYIQSYILDTGKSLVVDFFTFFGPHLTWGATYGIRLEMIVVLVGTGWYIWRAHVGVFKTILGVVSVYTVGFVVGSWPAILYTLSHIHNQISTLPDIYNYFAQIIFHSTLWHNTLHEGLASVSPSRFIELGFDKLASQVLFLISCLLGTILFWKIDRKKFLVVIRNMRLERIGSYLALLSCGMGFAFIHNFGNHIAWTDTLGIFCLILSWIGLWMYAVHNNDVSDIEIDKISNTERPLVKKEIDEKTMRETGYVWLTIALIGSWSAGFYPFFMSLVYLFASHIYSNPPLRLRRFPLVPSFLIGIASLSTVLAGFFFISIQKEIFTFPMELAVGIIIMVTLAINVKDMKDIAGDRANNIMTLPVIFPKNGPRIVGACFALSFLLVPIFLSFYSLYIFAIPASVVGFRLVTKKPYKEEPIFILRFVFLGSIAVTYIGLFILAKKFGLQ